MHVAVIKIIVSAQLEGQSNGMYPILASKNSSFIINSHVTAPCKSTSIRTFYCKFRALNYMIQTQMAFYWLFKWEITAIPNYRYYEN